MAGHHVAPVERVLAAIHVIRGQRVMLDSDLAMLYGVSTGRLNEQVRRNHERFPGDFMFQLSAAEVARLRSQIAISKPGRGGRRFRPHAFTEHGAAIRGGVPGHQGPHGATPRAASQAHRFRCWRVQRQHESQALGWPQDVTTFTGHPARPLRPHADGSGARRAELHRHRGAGAFRIGRADHHRQGPELAGPGPAAIHRPAAAERRAEAVLRRLGCGRGRRSGAGQAEVGQAQVGGTDMLGLPGRLPGVSGCG